MRRRLRFLGWRLVLLVLNKIHGICIHVLPTFGRGAGLKGLYRRLISSCVLVLSLTAFS